MERLFGNLFWFIDKLCAINDRLEFNTSYKNIYPLDLERKNESRSTSEASCFDLSIISENKKIKPKLFDKRHVFLFSMVGMPHSDIT